MIRCQCDDEFGWCELHVRCDSDCRALLKPETLEEALAALEHWRNHHYLSGCSHSH